MAGYQPYPEYKESGVEWLGEVPRHWEPKRLRFALRTNPSSKEIKLAPEDLVSFVVMDAVGEYGGLRLDSEKELSEVGSGYTFFATNDVVVAKITPCFENGKGAIAENLANGVAFGTTELHVLRPGPNLDPEYLFYITISNLFRNLGESEMYGAGGQKRVPESFIKDFVAALPNSPEQQTIARFLDHKTAQIDTLIAKKQTLLEKLAEKRTALISHAVTKGLDPNVKMKDSGVEWLGEVPEHWVAAPLRHFLTVPLSNGLFKKREHWGDGTKIVNVFDVYAKGDVVNEATLERVACDDSELEKYSIKHGDFVFVRSSLKLEGIGKSASAINPVEPLVFECHLVRGRPDARKVDPKYLCYFLNSDYSRESLVSLSNQVTMATLDQQKFKQLVITAPTIQEQKNIARFLDLKTVQIDEQVNKIIDAIEKLQEYRSALITQAVTGKIDVRKVKITNAITKGQAA